jgi:histidinol-phosphate phosphatase family protein
MLYLCVLKAIIIAGGKGTRMGSLTEEIPKPLLAPAGKTVLEYQLDLLKDQGVREVVIAIGHLGNKIQEHIGNGDRFGLTIRYLEESIPMGTAGCLAPLRNSIHETILVLYGDIILHMDFHRLLTFHKKKKATATLVVHPNDHPFDSDLVECDPTGKVTHFFSKPHPPGSYLRNLVNAAVYVFEPAVFNHINPEKKQDFGKDIFPDLITRESVFAYNTTEYIKDMGTPERMDAVARDIRSGKVERKSYSHPQKAIFLDRDGVLNEDTEFIKTPDELIIYPFTAEAVKKINGSDFASIVITNQSAVARNLCTESELRIIHNKLEWELGKEGAKLDAIYYCPHHPDRGFPEENAFYKMDCTCRKPKPGMIFQASEDFRISPENSFMIGDTDRDREAAKRAGVVFAGVRTGKACADLQTEPDYLFENLLEAAQFIVDEPLKTHFDHLLKLSEQCGKIHKPFIVLVGGQSRSGKSTFTSYLKQQFKKYGQSVLSIRADDWIMPASDRTGKETVLERFRMRKFEKDMFSFFNHEAVSLYKYDSKTRRLSEEVIYSYNEQDVVILEGVPLLCSEPLRKLADVAVFTEIGEEERKKRFSDFYRWKGLTDLETEMLYAERLADEFDLITRSAGKADLIIKTHDD